MCGIAGYLNPEGVLNSDIEKMNDAIQHRGPDGSGVFCNRSVGFGHRRLSIIDLAGGQQPMSNQARDYWITFNGEIYNYRLLRKALEGKYQFNTQSDTEVLLHLYEEKGSNCLQDIQGMFAFAIYDHKKKELFAARDHLGQKPLYYYHEGDRFAFSSEIKSLLQLKPELRDMDEKALFEYLNLRIITPPRSMFRKIRKLPPGHFLLFKQGELSIQKYWKLNYTKKLGLNFKDTLDALEERLLSTVKQHLVSDVPVGCFLSGGMDSGLIVAMMSGIHGEKFKTFSGDVPYGAYSERRDAKKVSDQYQTCHYEMTIDPSLSSIFPEVLSHLDEPSDLLSLCMYSIAGFARKEVKVVLGGDGGDELFGGYDRYYGNLLVSYYARLPKLLRKEVLGRLIRLIPDGHWYKSLGHQLKWMQKMSLSDGGKRYAQSLSFAYFPNNFSPEVYTKRFKDAVAHFDPEEGIETHFGSDNAKDVVDKMLYTDSMFRMPDHPIMVSDRMSMAHGLEVRSPFLDHHLVEFCAAIPSKFKVHGKKLRHIQVNLAKKYLPPSLINKKKQGFASPLTYLFSGHLKGLSEAYLEKSTLVKDGYLNPAAVDQLLQMHLNQKSDHGSRIWLLLNAEMWYRMYIKNESKTTMRNLLRRGFR